MKLRPVLLVMLFALPIQSFADFSDCAKFAGTYETITEYSRSPFLEVSWDASHLIFTYLEDTSGQSNEGDYRVSFIADGAQHDGDGDNTGTTYTASCSPDGITIVRTGLFNSPYITQVTLSAGVLTETDSLQGVSPQTTQYQFLQP